MTNGDNGPQVIQQLFTLPALDPFFGLAKESTKSRAEQVARMPGSASLSRLQTNGIGTPRGIAHLFRSPELLLFNA